jgi:hypothetical protein
MKRELWNYNDHGNYRVSVSRLDLSYLSHLHFSCPSHSANKEDPKTLDNIHIFHVMIA